jgi:uridine phosphorylase
MPAGCRGASGVPHAAPGGLIDSRAVPEPFHLRPVAAIADRALLPGDPGRALALAQVVLGDDRKMFNHHRGLWGYTGTASDGAPLTIQSTGMGGPSAAIVLEELAGLGVRTAIRVGTARAVSAELRLGDLVAATAVEAQDGTSVAITGGAARRDLTGPLALALAGAAGRDGVVASHDLLYAPDPIAQAAAWRAQGVLAADLETGALAAVAARHGIAFGAIVAIAVDARGGRLDDERQAAAGEAAGRAAARARGLDG